LLKRLTEAGDLLAKKVFIEEIAKRVECGYWPVIEYLIEERYIDFLSPKEFFEIILEDDTEVNLLLKIEKANEIKLYLEKELSGEYNNFRVKNKHVVGLCLDSLDIEDILHSIGSFKSLQELHIISCKLKIIPDSIGMLEELEILHLIGNQIEELPDSMKTLTSLIRLDLSENVVNKIPDMISEFTSLKTLVMNKNKVEKISPSILKLEKLKNVLLNKNPLEKNLDILKKLEKKGIKIVV
jgi:Leucine-rich repeat (LRR) protein